MQTGRNLLDSLAARGRSTAGWDVSSARSLAHRLVAREFAAAQVRPTDDLDEAGLLDQALDTALSEQESRFGVMAEGVGFRNAAHEAVRTLRIAGVTAEGFQAVSLADAAKHRVLARTLAEYESRLRSNHLADPAEVFHQSLAVLESGRLAGVARVYLVPGFRMRGLTGRFLAGLRARGAETLACDPTVGLDPDGTTLWQAGEPAHNLSFLHAPEQGIPTGVPELFAAASPRDELREVLRRVVALGLPWNQVEIITADPSYPALLDGLARRLGIPVRYATGLPAGRTPAGRAVAEHLASLEARLFGNRTSAAVIAAHAAEFLTELEADPVRDALLHRAERIAATLHRAMPSSTAIRSVQGRLALHVNPSLDEDDQPGGPDGLLLSEIQHGGRTGRAATFIVGLSADVFPGAGYQDPLLSDEDRRRIAAVLPEATSGLPSSGEILGERRHALAATLAGLRGHVTLSYPGWNTGEARPVDPAAVVLQAFRVRQGDPTANYQDLRNSLGGLCGPVPRSSAHLDGADVWFGALRGSRTPVDGMAQVRAAFAGLAGGLTAREALGSPEPGPHHGIVEPRPELWDPRRNPELIVSASRLETLGRCPHQYLLKYVLRARVPDQPAGPDTWLAPNHRGTLLHRVFDRTLKQARQDDLAHTDERFFEFALGMLDEAAEETRAEIAPPSEVVFLRERDDLRRDLRVWVASLQEVGVEWVDFEMEFGPDRDHPPVLVQLPGGKFWTLGAIDRVDRLPDGSLRIVDYKTGSPTKYARKTGIFDGGRRLQHFIYSRAAEALLDAPVDRMEYRFPSERGKNDSRVFTRAQLASGADLIDGMLNMVSHGHFLPTETSDDCRYCDYAAACRIRRDDRGNVADAPLAEWAAEYAEELDAYEPLLRARTAFN